VRAYLERTNSHAHKLQNLIIGVHEPNVREQSRDADAKQRRDDHLRQRERSDCASGKCLGARTHAQTDESAAEGYQAYLDARRAGKVGWIEDEGEWRLSVRRDRPEAR